jgi:hypothetical protein
MVDLGWLIFHFVHILNVYGYRFLNVYGILAPMNEKAYHVFRTWLIKNG